MNTEDAMGKVIEAAEAVAEYDWNLVEEVLLSGTTDPDAFATIVALVDAHDAFQNPRSEGDPESGPVKPIDWDSMLETCERHLADIDVPAEGHEERCRDLFDLVGAIIGAHRGRAKPERTEDGPSSAQGGTGPTGCLNSCCQPDSRCHACARVEKAEADQRETLKQLAEADVARVQAEAVNKGHLHDMLEVNKHCNEVETERTLAEARVRELEVEKSDAINSKRACAKANHAWCEKLRAQLEAAKVPVKLPACVERWRAEPQSFRDAVLRAMRTDIDSRLPADCLEWLATAPTAHVAAATQGDVEKPEKHKGRPPLKCGTCANDVGCPFSVETRSGYCASYEARATITKEALADLLIERLNEIVDVDPHAMAALMLSRVPCCFDLVNHPTVQVIAAPPFRVGVLGLLNGLVGVIDEGICGGAGLITSVHRSDGTIQRFQRTGTPCEPRCPGCGEYLSAVSPDSNSPLNRDQFDATRAGDWYCDTCPEIYGNGKTSNAGKAYFWDKDVR